MKDVCVLIVEDSVRLARLLRKALLGAEAGHVEVYHSAEAALERLQDMRFDLVVTDFHLGDMDGLRLLDRVSETHPGTSGMLMSASAGFCWQTLPPHIQAYLVKPFNLQEFLDAALRVLDRHVPT